MSELIRLYCEYPEASIGAVDGNTYSVNNHFVEVPEEVANDLLKSSLYRKARVQEAKISSEPQLTEIELLLKTETSREIDQALEESIKPKYPIKRKKVSK